MKKERKIIPLSLIEMNTGQLPWLPKNPRTWTQTDIDKTAESIKEDPDFLEDRPLLVIPGVSMGTFIVFAGNLRHEGALKNETRAVTCVIYYPVTQEDYDTVKRRAMKDNGSFGKFDWDEVFTSEWGNMPLDEWGIKTPEDWNADAGGGDSGQAQEDDFDEETAHIEVRCKPGDVWELGDHRLMCGDSIDLEQVKKLMGGAKLTYS